MTVDANLSESLLVQQYFQAETSFWKDVYTQDNLAGAIYRARRAGVLNLVDSLNLSAGARALEVGCGAGSTSVALAQRGLSVDAVDLVPQMLHLTRQAACAHGVGNLVSTESGDVHQLPFADESFDLAVAIGVMEWLSSLAEPLRELHRVLRPGGSLIVNIDNATALHCLLDPRMNPFLNPVKRRLCGWLERAGLITPIARSSRCLKTAFNEALRVTGFEKTASHTSGFGPFTMFGIHLLPQRAAVALHRTLQSMADRKVPVLRDLGDAYLVLLQKPASREATK